jgi:hypothetical protein
VSQILAPTCTGQCKQPSTKMRDVVHSTRMDPRQPWFWAQRITLHDASRCADARHSQALLTQLTANMTPSQAELAAQMFYHPQIPHPHFTTGRTR